MTSLKVFGAAVILAASIASAASAQPVIDEPRMFAFVHPDGDLGFGPVHPPAEAQAMAPRPVMRHPMSARHAKSSR